MKTLQLFTDRAAIGLSFLCTLHCLAVPVLIVLLPSLAALQLDNEAFHIWMVYGVVPTSVFALTIGCKQHKRYRLLFLGLVGITCLILAISLDEVLLGEIGEKVMTLLGAAIIAYGHYTNYRLCQHASSGCCPEHSESLLK